MTVVPFLSVHLDGFVLQEGQAEMAEHLKSEGYAEMLERVGPSWSCFKDDVFLMCGGIAEQGYGRGLVWTLIGDKVHGTDMVILVREFKKKIIESQYRRLEFIVKETFEQGHRLAKLMGFTCETPSGMIDWFESGERGFLYAMGREKWQH